jgi:hypothetical protein
MVQILALTLPLNNTSSPWLCPLPSEELAADRKG